MNHYEERLEADLARIRQRLNDLADAVSQAVRNAMHAVLHGDADLAHVTVLGDHPINRDSRELDRLCHAFIARHLPSARHLRLISSIIRVNVALERIGDYAVTIAREALQLSELPPRRVVKQLDSLSNQSLQFLDDAVAAFQSDNIEAARTLMSIPQNLHFTMDEIYGKLIGKAKKRMLQETVAEFVVFSLLKRIADQAKNICDQTVFAVAGEVKPPKFFRILFIDETNVCHSKMAEAIARKRFPEVAQFDSAGTNPAEEADPEILTFLEDRGITPEETSSVGLDALPQSLQTYNIVIILDKKIRESLPRLPFHTSALVWKTAALTEKMTGKKKQARLEEIYRLLTVRIEDLMEILVGKDAV
jgi:phosphate transport system protein